ncbi:MAG: hypothetical protein QGH33_05265 [Pirellulaceae bacterium]|nr:hypothetical protein [Pirellulaceae bacterium]
MVPSLRVGLTDLSRNRLSLRSVGATDERRISDRHFEKRSFLGASHAPRVFGINDQVAAGKENSSKSKIGFLKSHRDDLKLVEQRIARVTDSGRQWLDYTLTVQIRDVKQPIQVLIRVDPESKLPYLSRVTGQHNGQAFSYEATFDYPETGPQDIYAIGVPRDAKLVDRVPTGDVARLIAGVETGRARFDDFRAIVVTYREGYEYWWKESPEIIHRKGNRTRRDLCYYRESSAVKPADDVDVSEWWRKRAGEFRYSPTRIYIGGTDHSFDHLSITDPDGKPRKEMVLVQSRESGLNAEQWVPAFWSLTPDYVARPPLGVPNQHMEAVVDANPTGSPEGTVMLRVRRNGRVDAAPDPDADKRPSQPDEFRFWIDPAREHLVMRMDMMGDGDNVGSSYIVESVAQSPKGHWYPTRVRRKSPRQDVKDQILEYHVEFDVNIPDALFEVKQPLPVEEVLRRDSP